MPQTQPPFKLALAALFLDGAPRTAMDAYQALQGEYAAKAFFTPELAASTCQALTSIGIFDRCGLSDAGEILFKLTRHGTGKVRANLGLPPQD
ncbi:hypothetical protein LJC46_05320 [Desulfovibrio sp. OttesenSCG-928-G15]|nr:hypothetical protein [Desulfovibrio sp. OttesenSCG-928-G15]